MSLVGVAPLIITVTNDLPVKNVGELIAYAKKNPGKISFGSSGVGAAAHLTSEMMKQVAGIDMVHVPYKGTAPALADLASGNIQMLIDAPIGVMTQVRAGKIRALAMLSKNRVPGVEEVPTIVEAGGPLIESSTWVMFLAPAGTPKEIVDKMSAEVSKALKDESLRKRLAEQAVIPVGATPEETGKFLPKRDRQVGEGDHHCRRQGRRLIQRSEVEAAAPANPAPLSFGLAVGDQSAAKQ